MGPKPNPKAKAQPHPPPSERRKHQASNADQLPSKRGRQDMKDADEGDNTEEAKHDGADLDSWAEIEDEMVSKGKGKGNRRQGG